GGGFWGFSVVSPYLWRLRAGVRLLLVGEGAGSDVGGVGAGGFPDRGGKVGITANEARRDARAQAHHVVEDEDLAVAGRARADPDPGDPKGARDLRGEVGGNALQDHREASRLGERRGVGEDLASGAAVAPLNLETTELAVGLGRQPDVPHHGDVRGEDRLDGPKDPAASLDL